MSVWDYLSNPQPVAKKKKQPAAGYDLESDGTMTALMAELKSDRFAQLMKRHKVPWDITPRADGS